MSELAPCLPHITSESRVENKSFLNSGQSEQDSTQRGPWQKWHWMPPMEQNTVKEKGGHEAGKSQRVGIHRERNYTTIATKS